MRSKRSNEKNMRLGNRSPEYKCHEHRLWLVNVGEADGEEQLMCPVCLYEDNKMMRRVITEQKIKIGELEGE